MLRTVTIAFCESMVYKTSIMYKFWVFMLFIQTGLSSFPTIYQKETVTVYEGLEKNELVFEIDLFESHLQPFVIDLSMATESNLRDSLFENLNFILQTIDGLPIKDSLDEFEIRKKFAFKEKLLGILYSKDRNVRQTLPNDNYVGVSIISDDTSDIVQMFLNKTNVIGCSSNDAYRRNKVVCLKKYINLVLQPTHFYIGTDLLTAIHAVSKQLAINMIKVNGIIKCYRFLLLIIKMKIWFLWCSLNVYY